MMNTDMLLQRKKLSKYGKKGLENKLGQSAQDAIEFIV